MVEAAGNIYDVPFTYRKYFSPEQVSEMINAFKGYDTDSSGSIDAGELKSAITSMGHSDVSDEQVASMLKRVDKNADGTVDWIEFLDMMQTIKSSGQNFGQALMSKAGAAQQVQTASGGHHTYLDEEVSMIARTINRVCKDDPLLQERLPIDPTNSDLFHSCSDGMVLIHLINHIEKDAIDMRTVNTGSVLNIYKVRENLDQAFSVAKTMIKVIGVDAQTFLDKTPYLMLGILWQLVRILSMKTITLAECPEIYRLLQDGEELSDLQKLKSEDILIRWLNFHLRAAGQEPVSNLGSNLADSKKLVYVLNQLDPANCSLDALEEADDLERAAKMIASSKAMGVEDCLGPADMVKGNSKVNSVFVAAIFNTKHGLQELTQDEVEAAGLIDDDIEGAREERAIRMWINSMQIENCFIDNLFEEIRDGLVILRVCHRIDNASVDWSKPNIKPKNLFDYSHNANLAEEAMRFLGVKMTAIGAQDIVDVHKKNILAMVWQLMRVHYLKIIGSKTEKDLITWINEVVQPDTPIANFGDAQLSDGRALIKLTGSVEPRIINWDLVTAGETDE
mmetsp:Transcript_29274/g.36359  ORF Transcript_29274/g.36359 Transcript_29274/m.36359 type:complete len:564 (+) Transcript_29274:61-1752(+)